MFNKLKNYLSGDNSAGLGNSNKKDESKLKEEEDPLVNKLTSITISKTEDNEKSFIEENFALDFENLINSSIEKYNPKINELDLRYKDIMNLSSFNSSKNIENITKSDELMNNLYLNISDLDKMKTVGKISYKNSLTKLKEYKGKSKISYNGNRIEANSNFPTVRSDNCFIKGKWVYEVTLLTNNLFQIGWVRQI